MPSARHAIAPLLALPLLLGVQTPPPRTLVLDDLYRLRGVSEPELSPDGEWVAYTLSTRDSAQDQSNDDVWMARWDGSRLVRRTWSTQSEHTPRWSPDGRYLAFFSGREDDEGSDQLWVLDRAGGEAELGKPWTNTDLWIRLSAPFLHADRIVTPTLFMGGDKDFNVPLLNSEQMYQALRSLGRDTQLVIYPDQHHTPIKPSYERDRLARYLGWYGKYLKSDE